MTQQHSILLEAIDRKRELSIREFGRSDLYQGANIEELNKWYTQLIRLVKSNPPKGPVDKILIFGSNSRIIKIEYQYLDNQILEKEPSFEIHFASEE